MSAVCIPTRKYQRSYQHRDLASRQPVCRSTGGYDASRATIRRGGTGPVRGHVESRPTAATYWRRRVAAVALGLGLVVIGSHAASAVVVGISHPGSHVVVHYRVQPGDTMWSIARRVAPNSDPREIVDLLVEAHGSTSLQPGDVIDWAGN